MVQEERKDEAQSLLDPELMGVLERLSLMPQDRTQDRSGTAGPPRANELGIDFYEYAAFQPGLDVRHVDWSIYGRTGSLLVRAYESRRDLPACILIDTSASMGLGEPPKLQLVLRLAAALSFVGLIGYHPVRLIAFSGERQLELPHRMGRDAIYDILGFLRKLKAEGETILAAGITAGLSGVARRDGRLFLLSDFLDPLGLSAAFGLLGTTRRKLDLIALEDPADAELPQGPLEAVDPESGRSTPLLVTPELADGYRQRWAAHRAELVRRAHDIQATLHVVSSATPIEDAVLRVLA